MIGVNSNKSRFSEILLVNEGTGPDHRLCCAKIEKGLIVRCGPSRLINSASRRPLLGANTNFL